MLKGQFTPKSNAMHYIFFLSPVVLFIHLGCNIGCKGFCFLSDIIELDGDQSTKAVVLHFPVSFI